MRGPLHARSRNLLLMTLLFIAVSSLTDNQTYSQTIKIVAFGDSTTATRQTVRQVYADRIPGLLETKGITAEVINSGLGGSHTGRLTDNDRHRRQHALDRFDEAVRAHEPDVVIIQFGWNDSWVDSDNPNDPSRIPVEDYLANLTFIIETLSRDNAQTILMTPNRPRSTVEEWRVHRTLQYVSAVRELADLQSLPLVDVWSEYEIFDATDGQSSDDLLLDNVHPNDQGHELVAQRLASLLSEQ